MKVVDIATYRRKRELKKLQDKVGELAFYPQTGGMRQIKTAFKDWLKMSR